MVHKQTISAISQLAQHKTRQHFPAYLQNRSMTSPASVMTRNIQDIRNKAQRWIRSLPVATNQSHVLFTVERSLNYKDTRPGVQSTVTATIMKNYTTTTRKCLDQTRNKNRKRSYIPRKAAVNLTSNARNIFKSMLENRPRPEIVGIMLNYNQSTTGEPRMVFSFSYVDADEIHPELGDEGVSLEEVSATTTDVRTGETIQVQVPKSPEDSYNDGLLKLYIHHNAFLKVLGATVDVDVDTLTPILYDREGNVMDPNA